jgi:Uma2 family endonuclease
VDDRYVNGVPDLIIEVLSPGNRAHDLETKFDAYAKAGVAEYGIVDYGSRELHLYRLHDGHYVPPLIFKGDTPVTFQCVPSLSFSLNMLFEGAPKAK